MRTDTKPTLLRCSPYFPVADLAGASAYYQDVLGFELEYSGGDPPHFAIHARDGLTIMLRLVSEPEKIVPNEAQGGTWDVFFWVDNVNGLSEELRSRGATIVYDVEYRDEYNMDEFAVRDLDGYVLGFGQERTEDPG